jgi:hypothetical protein
MQEMQNPVWEPTRSERLSHPSKRSRDHARSSVPAFRAPPWICNALSTRPANSSRQVSLHCFCYGRFSVTFEVVPWHMASQYLFPALYLGIALFRAKCIMHIFKFVVDFGECQATAANELLVFCNLKQHTECLRCQRQCLSLLSATPPSKKL